MVGQVTTTQELLYNVTGQTLIHDADLTPTAVASVYVYEQIDSDDATAEVATTGSASIDAVSTTVDVAYTTSQSDPTLLYVAATTSMVAGRRYIVTDNTGEHEVFEVFEITAADHVRMRRPLSNNYSTSATVEGLRISISVDSTWIADKTNISPYDSPHPRYRVRWQYTAGGVTVVRATYLDVVRYASAHGVTGLDVDRAHPGFLDLLPTWYRRDQGRAIIDAAYDAVRLDLAGDEHGFARARNTEVMDALIVERANVMAQRSRLERGGGSIEAVDSAQSSYDQRYNQLIRSPGTRWDVDGSGAAVAGDRAPLFVR